MLIVQLPCHYLPLPSIKYCVHLVYEDCHADSHFAYVNILFKHQHPTNIKLIACTTNLFTSHRQIEWYRGDGNIIDANSTATETVPMADGKRSVVRSTLVLTAAAEHHDSHVTCRAHNAALSAPQTTGVSLRVTFRPEVTVSAESDTAAEFEDVRLHCAVRANPAQVRHKT